MIFNNEAICKLRAIAKDMLSDKRYNHTLGVEDMAAHLGSVLMPNMVDELRVAALLHDITKELSYEAQISLIESSDTECTKEDLLTTPALHSFSAAPYIIQNLEEYATQNILSAVANHTLGNADMSIFDEIIFLSDYIEQGRNFPACIAVRNYVFENINPQKSQNENVYALHMACLDSINHTIESLHNRNEHVNVRTIITKEYFDKITNNAV